MDCFICNEELDLKICQLECGHLAHVKCFCGFLYDGNDKCKKCNVKLRIDNESIINDIINFNFPIKIKVITKKEIYLPPHKKIKISERALYWKENDIFLKSKK
jgi:hypothetical protein